VVLAVAAISAASLAAEVIDGETTHPPTKDVDGGWSCSVDAEVVRASGSITNHSSKTSFYMVEVEFRVGGDVVEQRGASIDDVEPGETALVEVTTSLAELRRHGSGAITCEVGDVDRFKA
jgi:hypothetical protein